MEIDLERGIMDADMVKGYAWLEKYAVEDGLIL